MSKIEGKSILIVDDEHDICEMLSTAFINEGCKVRTAENGYIALKKIEEETPDIILSDIRMPILDGVNFQSTIRDLIDHGNVLLFFITGFSDIDFKESAQMGAKALIKKPVRALEVIEVVKEAIDD